MKTCCPCDELLHPAKPDIPAGLPVLPRQLAGFPEYRLAMLRSIPRHAPLSQWRAREGDDLGIMLLEMWAYVLDILGFYDERIANETYLRTAMLRPSTRKLVGLIGYQPRPALGASVVLAAIAEGRRPVKVPPRTGFRSDAFDGKPPQVFETEGEHQIHPLKNEWTLGPVREQLPGDEILLEPGTAALQTGDLVLTRWTNTASSESPIELRAGRVAGIGTVNALDGHSYKKLEIASARPMLDSAVELSSVELLTPTQKAFPSLFRHSIFRIPPDETWFTLDAIYPQLAEDDPVIVQRGQALHAAVLTRVGRQSLNVHRAVDVEPIPVTGIAIRPALDDVWNTEPERLVIHFGIRDGGKLTRVSKTHLNAADLASPDVPIDGVVEPIPESVAKPSELLLLDARDNGVLARGAVNINASGAGKVQLATDTPPFHPALRTPVTVFGNLVRATRGESLFNEVLGSGDASQAFPSFTLSNNPLTYINDPAAPNGRRTTLEVRVNGIKWKEVSSFFGTGPEDEVYIVRQNDDGETVVTFGDGATGLRFPTGIDNVTATYRFGAGAAKPPAGGISQLAKPVEGLRRVVNPVAAGGGADADQPKDIRTNAPNSALILGRAVSVQDFEALAREFGGVINAHVEWAWDETCQGAVVKVWFISDGGDIKKDLEAFLIGQADPNTPLVAEEAKAELSELIIDVDVDPRFNSATVVEQVTQELTNPDTGILALQNIPIGRPLFRSRIFDAVLAVKGTLSVRAMTVDGKPAPFAITVEQGRYRNFLDDLKIGNTVVGDMLIAGENEGAANSA